MAYTDTDVATGALGLAIGGAIVQFNKVAVMPSLVNMIACAPGAVTARVPVYTKLAIANVETASAGAEGAENSEVVTTTPVDIEVLRNHIDVTITDLAAHGNTDALMINAGQAIGNAVALEFDAQCLTGRVDEFATTVGANTTGMSMNKLFTAVAKLEWEVWQQLMNQMVHCQVEMQLVQPYLLLDSFLILVVLVYIHLLQYLLLMVLVLLKVVCLLKLL